MKLRALSVAGLVCLGAMAAAPAASAQGTPTQPPNQTQPPSQPPPNQPPPNVIVIGPNGPVPNAVAPQPGTLGPVPADKVRVHLRAFRKNDTARLYVEQGTDRWALACTSPCGIDLRPGSSLRVTLNDDVDNVHDFSLQTEGGREVELSVRPASKGALAGGIVMISLGGTTALVGLLILALSDLSTQRERGAVQLAGGVTTIIGAGLVVGGVLLLANRSKEPRITQENVSGHERDRSEADVPARRAFLDDGANERRGLAISTSSLPPATTPFTWGFTF